MRKLPVALAVCLALVACRKDETPPPSVSAAPVADTSRHDSASAPTSPDTARRDTGAAKVAGFDRIPIDRIDSALNGYDAGDTLSRDSIGDNACLGLPVMRYRMANHLEIEGHNYNIYACKWRFSGAFSPVLGLAPGMSSQAVLKLLGRPRQQAKDTLIYLSEKPDDYDSSNFDSRWTLELRFKKEKLKTMHFEPFFDDC